MSIPNRYDVVQQLEAEGYFRQAATGDQRAASYFARLVAYRLNPTGDPAGFGWLTKVPGETQVEGYAEDAIVYGRDQADANNVVDLIAGAGAPGARTAWQAGKPRRISNTWEAPKPLTPEQLAYLKGEAQIEPPPVSVACRFQPAPDLGPVLARVADMDATMQDLVEDVDALHDTVSVMYAAVVQTREMVQALRQVLAENGLQVEASAKWIGPIRGTAKLPEA